MFSTTATIKIIPTIQYERFFTPRRHGHGARHGPTTSPHRSLTYPNYHSTIILLTITTKSSIFFIVQYVVINPDKILVFDSLSAMRLIYHQLHFKSTSNTKNYYMIKLLQKTHCEQPNDANIKVLSLFSLSEAPTP